MQRSRRLSAVVPLCVALAVLAGCGDDPPAEVAELSDMGERPSTTNPAESDELDSTSTTEDAPVEIEDQEEDASADAELCAAFQAIADADDEFETEMDGLLQPVMAASRSGDRVATQEALDEMAVEMQAMLADALPDLLGAYDRLAAVAPTLADDVVILRDFTDEFVQELASAGGSIEQMNAVFEGTMGADALSAANATLRLDEVSRSDCGIVIAD